MHKAWGTNNRRSREKDTHSAPTAPQAAYLQSGSQKDGKRGHRVPKPPNSSPTMCRRSRRGEILHGSSHEPSASIPVICRYYRFLRCELVHPGRCNQTSVRDLCSRQNTIPCLRQTRIKSMFSFWKKPVAHRRCPWWYETLKR